MDDEQDDDEDDKGDQGSDILPTPAAKRLRRTNFQQCIICQAVRNEALRSAMDSSVERFVDALKARLDHVYDRVFLDVQSLSNQSVLWHSSCYESYTSKQNLRYIKNIPLPSENENDDGDSSAKSRRSISNPMEWFTCLFCKRKTHKKVKKMISVTTFEACQSIRSAAETKGDEDMLHILRSVNFDLIAAEAVYHKACHASYVSKTNLKYQAQKEESMPKNEYEEAFHELVNSVENNIMSGKSYDMNTLLIKYKSLLEQNGVQAESYTRQRLKLRLTAYFKDNVVFHQPFDRTKPELVYSSSITLKDVINACTTSEATEEASTSFTPEQHWSNDLDISTEKRQLIYKVAKLIKSDISDCKGICIRPLDVNDLSLASSKAIIPKTLYWLLRWVITTDEFNSETEFLQAEPCQNISDERKILMAGQDVVHCASHSRVKLPKHVSLAVSVRHLTGSKQLITLLNRMGHCSSYDDVEVIDTGLANEVLAMSEGNRCVIPSNISQGAFIHTAADNNDINEETLDGKNTTHATTHVVYQRAQPGNMPQRREAHADHSSRKRSLDTSRPASEIQEIGVFGKRPPVSNKIAGQVNEEWFNPDKKLFVAGCIMDMAWMLLRLQSTNLFQNHQQLQPSEQCIPGWSGFYSLVFPSLPCKTSIGYCPMLNARSDDFSTIYTIMKNTEEMGHRLGQDISVITFDLLIYMKAKQVQWKFQEEFANTIVRMGGFHIALNYLSLLGKKYSNSGLEDLLIESGVYGASTTTSLISGKSYNRGIRAHKLVMEALFRLIWQEFVKWLLKRKEAGINSSINEPKLLTIIEECQNAVKDNSRVSESINGLMDEMEDVVSLFYIFKEEAKAKSYIFVFWLEYISMVITLLQFVKAERTANWELHLLSTAAMVPHFFAMDRPNYARWLPVYLIDMYKIKENFPIIWEEFNEGNFSVSRSRQPFAQVWTDMALEQSVNLDSKSKGGIIGISQKPGALERWFLTAHERAAITTSLKEMCGYEEVERVGTHKEARKKRVNKDEQDVQKIIECFTSGLMTNPFALDATATPEEKLPLVNIASGVTLPNKVSEQLVHATKEGHKRMKDFINNRLDHQETSFWDPISKLKIKTFSTITKVAKIKTSNEKVLTINADRELFGRMVVVARKRDIDLKDVLSYELSAVPIALAHTDGTLRKTTKSVLLSLLEEVIAQNIRPSLSASALTSAIVIDGMAMIQMLKNANEATFGKMATKYFDHFMSLFSPNCSRIDVVFDQYRNESIKCGERERRGESTSLEVKIYSSSTPVPKQWLKYIGNPRNKLNLMGFLSETWCTMARDSLHQHQQLVLAGGFKDGTKVVSISGGASEEVHSLFSDQEEADTRMLLHAKHHSTKKQI
ncbi:hypothetical protein QZH41_003454 [Actinostola sp. cb2023]|nr:hypothetical protein QZH41_003454 [Actinostola sp. cb2023]